MKMKHYGRGKDFRRFGYVFQDDIPMETAQENMTAAENWKSVMTELHEKKIKTKGFQGNFSRTRKTIDSSFDSGIQQEYNSDNDEVCNSICMTLNRLVELSKKQQLCVNYSESLNNITEIDSLQNGFTKPNNVGHRNYTMDKSNSKSIDCLSTKSFASETNNLVEEVFMKNSCSIDNDAVGSLYQTVLGRFSENNSASIGYRYLSSSAQNLTTLPDSNKDKSLQPFSSKRTFIKNNVKNKVGVSKCVSEVVVAIDIGTSYSGFAYAIDNFTSGNSRVMTKTEGPHMKKISSILLLNSKTEFHSFGNDAKNYFLNIEHNANGLSSQWLLFEKFKLQLLNISEINRECKIKAVNGISIPALIVYTRTLYYFKCLAMQEISTVLQQPIKKEQIQWIVSIPIMWSVKGKLFIQEAAFNAGLCTIETANKLTVLYEAEAVATWCNIFNWNSFIHDSSSQNLESYYFLVVNCGGGIVDMTVHQTQNKNNCIISEVHKSPEIIYSSFSINEEFIQLLISIFGSKFMNLLQVEKPTLLIELLYEFEACQCYFSNVANRKFIEIFFKNNFSEFYQKVTGLQLAQAVTNFCHKDVIWSKTGALDLSATLLKVLFQPLLQKIVDFIEKILRNRMNEKQIWRIYFTGGLTKSDIFRNEMKDVFENKQTIIFIQDEAELCVMKGAIQKFGYETFKYSKMSHSYAIGVIKEFQNDVHSIEKLVLKDGHRWCCDLLDWIVRKNQILQEGEVILKRYRPTASHQSCIIINIYAVEHENSKYVTDQGVHSCGVLRLSTSPADEIIRHEILLQFIFAGNEFFVNALDTLTGRCNQIQLDNLSYL